MKFQSSPLPEIAVSKYHLPEGYNERLDNEVWDDSRSTDEWQNEVYVLAKKFFLENGFDRVCDLGCGSGFKLMKYFGDYETVGVELSNMIWHLNKNYPKRRWIEFGQGQPFADLVICADVLEHVRNPDTVMEFIKKCYPKMIILSTPERDVREEPELGPPSHWPHCREWNMPEFKAYVEDWFRIERGPEIFGPQFVQQLVVCSPK